MIRNKQYAGAVEHFSEPNRDHLVFTIFIIKTHFGMSCSIILEILVCILRVQLGTITAYRITEL